jgi:hypothetical protein
MFKEENDKMNFLDITVTKQVLSKTITNDCIIAVEPFSCKRT